jgi:hypothetical protein
MDDDTGFPDGPDNEPDPTARGIVHCLRMLAGEAAALGMARTLDALKAAITVCTEEGDASDTHDGTDDLLVRVAGSSRIH